MMTTNAKIFLDMLQAGKALELCTIQDKRTYKTVGRTINGKRVSDTTFLDVKWLPAYVIFSDFVTIENRKNYHHKQIMQRDTSKPTFD